MNNREIPVSRPKDAQFAADIIRELKSRDTEKCHRFRWTFREDSSPAILMEHRTLGMKTVMDPGWFPSDVMEWGDAEAEKYHLHVRAAADTAWEKMTQTEQEITEIGRLFRKTGQEGEQEEDTERE
jgi:uncharacterized protein YecE (DUF72 family)